MPSSLPAQRRLQVPGTRNFRDLGGYRTEDGAAQTAWRRLYRADHLGRVAADSAACAFLRDQLHVSCTVDLRSASERRQQPYNIAGVTVYRIPMAADTEVLQRVQSEPQLTEEVVETLMRDVYRRFVVDAKAQLGRLFRLLVERGRSGSSEEALVMHCKAGKDRTGMCAALLLSLLGVPRETVFEDYLLTNEFYEVPPLKAVKATLKGLVEPAAASALFQARRSYLQCALQTIEKDYHDVHTYVRDALGISDEDIELLKTAYLQPV